MTDLNHVIEIGRLVSQPSMAYTASGTARMNMSIAVNRSEKSNGQWSEKVSFFDVTVWGKQAETLNPYLTKGKQIAVEGYLDQQRWQKDGKNYSKIVIVADRVQLLGGKDGTAESEMPRQAQGYQDAGSGDDFPEDLPF